jgi:hypothetical protein
MGFRVVAVSSVIALACVVLLVGCAPAAVDPMNDQFRSAIRQDRADRAWETVSEQYPEALRPQITVGPVLDDTAWATATQKCFKDEGFIVVRSGTTFQYSSSQGQSPLQFAVAQYHCAIAEPSLSELAGYLDANQLGALYDYYLERVQPCLALSGVPTSKPPSREQFEAGYGSASWTPFLALIKANKTDGGRLASLQRACPPLPSWLHL